MAASIKEIVNSCLSLAKNNDGCWKSEKQAKFLSGFFIDGSLAASVAYSFGEFNGCTRRVDYVITINETGIQKIVKNGVVHWENTPEQISKQNAVKARREAAHKKELQEIVDYQLAQIEENTQNINKYLEGISKLTIKGDSIALQCIKTLEVEITKLNKDTDECKELVTKYLGYINK